MAHTPFMPRPAALTSGIATPCTGSERAALLRVARRRIDQFLACAPRCPTRAVLAEAALHAAITAGISRQELATELALSPLTLSAILTGDTALALVYPAA